MSTGRVFGWMPSPSPTFHHVQNRAAFEPPSISSNVLHAFGPQPAIERPSSRTSSTISASSELLPPASASLSSASDMKFSDSTNTNTPPNYSLSSSERRALRNRKRDPSWVPRPRNAFIIFRCEYSREHAREGSSSSSGIMMDKTLSKRAGEAWRRLSAVEKIHYQERAKVEKDEHARRNPHYRFNPMRNRSGTVSSTSTTSSSRSARSRNDPDHCARVASFTVQGTQSGNRLADSVRQWESKIVNSPKEEQGEQVLELNLSPFATGRRRSCSDPFPSVIQQRECSVLSSASSPGSLAWADVQPHADDLLFRHFSFGTVEDQPSPVPLDMVASMYPSMNHAPLPYQLPYTATYPSHVEAIASSLADWTLDDGAAQSPYTPSESASVETPQSTSELGLPVTYPFPFTSARSEQASSYFPTHDPPVMDPTVWTDDEYAVQPYMLGLEGMPAFENGQTQNVLYDLNAQGVAFDDFFNAL
ncbi:hypothetical protein EW146_g1238 [Bondarzewia mesenterica]|uniref:HMG box domain-containing protein n=1 Tax=Bondarzewia mesenterica TaxID=1095465 RepID=A0A4S4M504_9AGAM|nr:hypothetical protein EW146_g1238 [Bondarzewia mesenterica]